jgi:hypothetical protein
MLWLDGHWRLKSRNYYERFTMLVNLEDDMLRMDEIFLNNRRVASRNRLGSSRMSVRSRLTG